MEVRVEHTCARCLTAFTRDEVVAVSSMFLTEPDEDGYLLEGNEVDLEQMLRDETLLSLPMLPRCGPDCPGVVSSAGTDLNTGPPGGREDESGSPFAALRDLLDPES